MSARLVVLGLLRSQPLYGYELKQRIDGTMGAWTNIAFGSIYYALGKLTEEGLIEEVGTEREGKRPSRTVYGITDAGRDEFERLLRETWAKVEPQSFTFDIALSFVDALPAEETKHYLRDRVMQLEYAARVLDRREEDACQEEGSRRPLTSALFDHQRVHLEAELNWTLGVLERTECAVFGAELANAQPYGD